MVLSTNIAETGVTIPDVVYVLDTGKMKESRYDSKKNISSLRECYVSQANVKQRKGRAGRVRPGYALELFTRYVNQTEYEHPMLSTC